MSKRHLIKRERLNIEKLDPLLIEIEGYCYSSAILTFNSDELDPFIVDVERDGPFIKYGYAQGVKELLMAKLSKGGSIILRSFLSENHPDTGHPMKEIRGYIVQIKDSVFDYMKISPEILKECCEIDNMTGKRLEMEKDVIYC